MPEVYLRKKAILLDGDVNRAKKLLSIPEPPTAIFAVTDMMAIGVMRYLRRRGIKIPEEISIIGFNDIPMASFTDPLLTTMAQPSIKMGATAVEIILRAISGQEVPEKKKILKAQLVIRVERGSDKKTLGSKTKNQKKEKKC